MDFDFRSFSTRSFERFTQALAAQILGPGLMIFGDGPDGAREATYDGILNFPSTTDKWSGYTILQSKFLQIPKTPADDANWLAAQLQAELEKFLTHGSKLRKPKYYILVSNARLSPQPTSSRGKGGLAKIDTVFAKFRRKLGLKDYRVWHLDQISTFLMNADSLRRSYAAWISTSDVIADLLADLGIRKKATSNAMYRYLARELRTHQPIRLQQAGHSDATAVTMIEDVFTDLPFRQLGEPQAALDNLLLATLLDRARDRLDQESVKAQARGGAGRPERILLLGGPGQGKSTVSQFMTQIFRANILSTDQGLNVPTEVQKIVESTLKKSAAISLGPHVPKRFPFRVDLPSFADKLSAARPQAGSITLLRYLSSEIAQIADAIFEVEDLRTWLTRYPSVFLLDGLDEVPPSANRAAVIRAISDFWDEAVECDVLMIVTTRPQGYNNDLDPSLYTKLEMTELNGEQALSYATKLAINRLPDVNQRDRVLKRMSEAAASPATSRLMISPLQVAILLALIDQRGDAPSDRWSLFDKYFLVVLDREQGKAGPVGETMRHWSRQITALHYKAGFLLHVEAETQGNSEAYLTREDLRNLISGQLADEHFEGAELVNISTDLLAASTERLVLLVQREEERFSFEVRSLQEFMAAAYTMTGREALVQERLLRIANRSHWLHVFQIAASKCFAVTDVEHLRDTIITICRSLNEAGDEIDRFLRTGSRLALALLEDGLAYDQPRYRRMLFSLALDLLSTGPNQLSSLLVRQSEKEPARTVEQLKLYLTSTLEETRDAAWLLLLRCANSNQQWAKTLLNDIWPCDADDLARIVALTRDFLTQTPIYEELRTALEAASLNSIAKALSRTTPDRSHQAENMQVLFPCLRLLTGIHDDFVANLFIDGPTGITFSVVSIEISPPRNQIYHDVPETTPWAPLQALITFHRDPSASALGLLLEMIETKGWLSAFAPIINYLPWPLTTILWLEWHGQSLASLAEQARIGAFGDRDSWHAAEARWRSQGVIKEDLLLWQAGTFFDTRVATVGAPWTTLGLTQRTDFASWVESLFVLGIKSQGTPRIRLKAMLQFIAGVYTPSELVTLDRAMFLVECGVWRSGPERLTADVLQTIPLTLLDEPTLLAELNRLGENENVYLGSARRPWKAEIYRTLVRHLDDYPGLLVFLGTIMSSSSLNLEIIEISADVLTHLKKSNVPIVAGYACVFSLLKERPSREDVEAIFEKGHVPGFPVTLLRLTIEGVRLLAAPKLSVGGYIAERLNRSLVFESSRFTNALRAIADQRLAPLREADCWRALELGEMLFAQIGRRAPPA